MAAEEATLHGRFGLASSFDLVYAHAVNSVAELRAALADERVHMLEADLLAAEDGPGEAGHAAEVNMAHPPERASDLTFAAFLAAVLEARKGGRNVGLKLDYKEFRAVPATLALLREEGVDGAAFPLLLNADVLVGPGGANGHPPLPARRFVEECTRACPHATLSLGWTHGTTLSLGYTDAMVREMLDICRAAPRVTFAAAASHLWATGAAPREVLIEHVEGAETAAHRSLSLWGPSPPHVREWLRTLHEHRTYADLKEASNLEHAALLVWAGLRMAGVVS